MNHEGAKVAKEGRDKDAKFNKASSVESVAKDFVDAALKVHKTLGPGLLESAYRVCLAHELRARGHRVEEEVPLPVVYDSVRLDAGYRLDLVVDECLIVELKAVEGLLPVHQAQLITYLKLSGFTVGFLVNFNAPRLKDGLHRFVN